MQKKKGQVMRIVCLVMGALLIIQPLIAAMGSRFNLGLIMTALLGIPLLFIGIFYPFFYQHTQNGSGKVVKYVIIIGYLTFGVVFGIFSSMVFRASHQKAEPGKDAMIVLGAALRGRRVSRLLAYRLDVAIDYAKENPETLIVVSGGQGPQEERSEAAAMADYLEQNGIEKSRILLEEQSTSTQENFLFSKQLLDERFGEGNYSSAFATSGFHVWRAEKVAKKMGLEDCTGVGGKYDAYLAPNHYLREFLATIEYRMTGKI